MFNFIVSVFNKKLAKALAKNVQDIEENNKNFK